MSIITMYNFRTDAARVLAMAWLEGKDVEPDYSLVSADAATEIREVSDLIVSGHMTLSAEYATTYNGDTYKCVRFPLIERYSGCVLSTYERNGYHDSDFYAVVWNGTGIEHIEYASTRGWSYCNGATVDATDDIVALAAEYVYRQCLDAAWERAYSDACKLQVGSTCEVIKGRTAPKGTVFTVTGVYTNTYDEYNSRIYGVDAAGNQVKTYENNVKVLFDADMMLCEAEIIRNARNAAANRIASSYRAF